MMRPVRFTDGTELRMDDELRAILEKSEAGISLTDDEERLFVERVHRHAIEQRHVQPSRPIEAPTVHYTELQEVGPDDPCYPEWNTYLRELGRLLQEGHEGKFVLIHSDQIIGIWDSWDEIKRVRLNLERAPLLQRIRSREPITTSRPIRLSQWLN